MLSSNEIRNVKFSNSVGGYKREEVDILLDKIEMDYDQFERIIRELNFKVEEMNREIENFKSSQTSIQNVLLSAQKLADQIVDEAKEKSSQIIKDAESNIAEITQHEQELSSAFERKAMERKQALETELEQMVEKAQTKAESIEKACADSVRRQQQLFDRLKLDVVAFRADISRRYKEHIELLQKLPDEVPVDPKTIADALTAKFDARPDINEFVENNDTMPPSQADDEAEDTAQTPASGFVINPQENDNTSEV